MYEVLRHIIILFNAINNKLAGIVAGDTSYTYPESMTTTIDAQSIQTKLNEIDAHLAENANEHGNLTLLKTTAKTDLVSAVNELFQNANNGKDLIANVVGSPLLATDTFQQQKNKIQTLKNALAANLTDKEQASLGTEELSALINKVANVNVGKRWAKGDVVPNSSYFEVRGLNFKPTIIIVQAPSVATMPHRGITIYAEISTGWNVGVNITGNNIVTSVYDGNGTITLYNDGFRIYSADNSIKNIWIAIE